MRLIGLIMGVMLLVCGMAWAEDGSDHSAPEPTTELERLR
jgi:hypothetical protein